jgi:hypothetical protein
MAVGIGTAVALQGVLGLVQTGVGIAKAKAATRPEYFLPSAVEEQMTEAQRMSYYGLPDEQKREFLDNISRSTAGSVRGFSDRRAGVGAIAGAAQGERDAYKSMLSADSAARMANIDRLQNIRSVYAQYEDKAFGLNELEPYMQEVEGAAALSGAGMQNIGGALNSLALGSIYGVMGDEKGGGTTSSANKNAVTDGINTVSPMTVSPLAPVSERVSSIEGSTLSNINEVSNRSFAPNEALLNALSMLGSNLGRP